MPPPLILFLIIFSTVVVGSLLLGTYNSSKSVVTSEGGRAPAPAPAPATPAPASPSPATQTQGQVLSTQGPAPAPASPSISLIKTPVAGSLWDKVCLGLGTYDAGKIRFTQAECDTLGEKVLDKDGYPGSSYLIGNDCSYSFTVSKTWLDTKNVMGSYSVDCAADIK